MIQHAHPLSSLLGLQRLLEISDGLGVAALSVIDRKPKRHRSRSIIVPSPGLADGDHCGVLLEFDEIQRLLPSCLFAMTDGNESAFSGDETQESTYTACRISLVVILIPGKLMHLVLPTFCSISSALTLIARAILSTTVLTLVT